jgi:ABC-type nitrate/sulfonate/bicarbonate transport system permease component
VIGSVDASRVARSLRGVAYALLGILVIAAVIEVVARANILPNRYFPATTEVLRSFWTQLSESTFWSAVGATLGAWAVGFAVATAVAVPLGLVLGTSRLAYRASYAIVEFLRPVPSVALIPLAILLFGRNTKTALVLVIFGSFWPVLVQTTYGARSADPLALATARSFRVPARARFWRVLLPSALPYVATGVRIGSAIALILAVTAELIVGVPGLGNQITLAQTGGDAKAMYVFILATGLLGWLLALAFTTIERRALSWHDVQQPDEI